MRVRVAPIVDWRAAVADVVKIGVAGIEAVELRDHGVSLLSVWWLGSPLALDTSTARKRSAVRGGGSGRAKSEGRGSGANRRMGSCRHATLLCGFDGWPQGCRAPPRPGSLGTFRPERAGATLHRARIFLAASSRRPKCWRRRA